MSFVPEVFKWQCTFDHLNNNEKDNRTENLVFACWSCNQKKKNSPELQLIAAAKLKENELIFQSLSVGERKKLSHTRTEEDEFTEVEVNRIINEITQKFLAEHLLTIGDKPPIDEYIPYTESLNCITFLVKSTTGGRGSQQAVRRSIDAYCCSLGKYQVIRDEGIRIIRRRKGN